MASLWEQTWEEPGFPALEGDLSTDVLIIGGGTAGCFAAYVIGKKGENSADKDMTLPDQNFDRSSFSKLPRFRTTL